MTIFESWRSSRAFGRALELPLLASMGRVLAVLMSVYLCVELRESLAADLPLVECDANQMQQVLIVLLVNASEAMPKGGTVSLSTALDPATDRVLVRVKDTGSGIPEDVLPHIFEPFFTTKQDQLRTGLGLAVAHSIAEQHGGEISVQSTPEEGTEFSVALPVSAAGYAMGPPVATAISGKSQTMSINHENASEPRLLGRGLVAYYIAHFHRS